MPEAPGLPVERDGYRYLALRREDAEPLRRFRNAQMDVLRQAAPISPEEQERWFDEVAEPAQHEEHPPMMLVSILGGGGRFIGYGGLTSIDWEARRAEVSFLVDPERAADARLYERDMVSFLGFLADWSFGELGLNRLFTETYAFRALHIGLLERAGFSLEGRLREHAAAPEGVCDSVIHGLLAAER